MFTTSRIAPAHCLTFSHGRANDRTATAPRRAALALWLTEIRATAEPPQPRSLASGLRDLLWLGDPASREVRIAAAARGFCAASGLIPGEKRIDRLS